LLAEIIGWFDLVGIQEVNDNLEGLETIQDFLPSSYQIIFNDKAGNDERAAFVYDSSKISQLEMVGEVAVAPSQIRWITLPDINRKYNGFDRNPFFVSFQAGAFEFIVANVHLFFGSHNKADVERRALEAYAVARWADLRHDDAHKYTENFLVLGDFNLPKYEPGDEIYTALKRRGLQRPEHSTKIGSNLPGDKEYDQILFTPGPIKHRIVSSGIFDFDTGIFPKLWNDFSEGRFRSYLRYYMSDHRPMWTQIRTS
jgi:endonuclease/exonuclease/phosphatase family metal-dependent hydrolase